MRVVDTSAWLEWFVNSPAGGAVGLHLPAPGEWLVPTIVQLELTKWLTREVGEEAADRTMALSSTFQVIPLDTPIALSAAEICAANKLATADAIVYATALAHGADVLTCDAAFKDLPGVIFVGKTSSA
ncbi:MAG: type II toxin-antitoxin system VapC family toxin [Parvularculaceae bacterium]|nr:type II toxin-antitoxin system VapC family toxin [Parvularculaceae bacterium]